VKEIIKQAVAGTALDPIARKLHIRLSRALGLMTEAEEKNRIYDAQTIEIMKRVLKPDSCCVDVGCHEGSVLKDILAFSPNGQHYAFEPIPAMFADLKANFGHLSNVHFYDVALSEAAGTSTFQHVVSNPGYSGLRKRHYDRAHEDVQEITVKVERLDVLLPPTTRVDFVKVDVEGAELQVFKGAVELFKAQRPIMVFEHGLGAADHYGTTPEQIHDLLVGQCGLKICLMGDWLAQGDRAALTREQFGEQFRKGKNYYFMAHR
jgi:FkbM family methyltransferase